jgi:microcystin-dependent protein
MMRVAGNTGVTLSRSSTQFQHVVCDGTSVYNVDQSESTFSTLEVTGAATFDSTVTVSGAATFKNNVSVSGNVVAAEFYGGGSNLTGIVTIPTGAILPYAGGSAPSGHLLCYGQAISRSTYSDLFSAIGTTYGVGDGSSTFNIPDLRGRVVAGQDDMGGSSANRLTDQSGGVNGDVLGDTGGAETHTLTVSELAAHTHSTYELWNQHAGNPQSPPPYEVQDTSGGTTGSAGGDSAHNNVQPTIILNYIIKT